MCDRSQGQREDRERGEGGVSSDFTAPIIVRARARAGSCISHAAHSKTLKLVLNV